LAGARAPGVIVTRREKIMLRRAWSRLAKELGMSPRLETRTRLRKR
jgi:hypothetical protein